MPPGPSVRVLLFHPDRPVSRATIDWIVDRQRHARVIVPPSLSGQDALPPRALHEPFSAPDPVLAGLAAEAASLLAGPPSFSRALAETALLALLEDGAVLVSDTTLFRELVRLSSWSMNVPERPTDGLLVQHVGIASRLPSAWRESAVGAASRRRPGRDRQVDPGAPPARAPGRARALPATGADERRSATRHRLSRSPPGFCRGGSPLRRLAAGSRERPGGGSPLRGGGGLRLVW